MPFLDENHLICVGSRLQHSDISFREQHPWVLPTYHRILGTSSVLTWKSDAFWGQRLSSANLGKIGVLRGRQLVKWVVSWCHISQKLKVKPVQQVTAPLARGKVTECPPFEVTGVDFTGPLYVRSSGQPKAIFRPNPAILRNTAGLSVRFVRQWECHIINITGPSVS